MSITIGAFINRHHLNKDGLAKVSIRITFNRIKKYYPLDLGLVPDHFDKIITARRRSDADREIYDLIQAAELRAKEVAKELPIFSFDLFEREYLGKRAKKGTVSGAFLEYIDELKKEGRIGTAQTYVSSKNSLEKFQKEKRKSNQDLKFPDITAKLLREYEKWMTEDLEKSISYVGINLRNLRALFNRSDIHSSIYPFGSGKDKYEIPTGRNVKKALSLEDIVKIANYSTTNQAESFARDMFIFSFQCSGINVKDIISLKRSNINSDTIRYERAKTAKTKREKEPIIVSLKEESKEVIKRWGNVIDLNDKDPYVFPILKKGMSPEQIRRTTQQTIKNINKYLKRIASSLAIKASVTTYHARHSFATLLLRSGASIEFISGALGHSEIKTTSNYLAGFEEDAIHKTTSVLENLIKKNA